jgi:hypothetical protein
MNLGPFQGSHLCIKQVHTPQGIRWQVKWPYGLWLIHGSSNALQVLAKSNQQRRYDFSQATCFCTTHSHATIDISVSQ